MRNGRKAHVVEEELLVPTPFSDLSMGGFEANCSEERSGGMMNRLASTGHCAARDIRSRMRGIAVVAGPTCRAAAGGGGLGWN